MATQIGILPSSTACGRGRAAMRALTVAAAVAMTALPLSARAGVDDVLKILQNKGNAGVVRGPKTIDDAARDQLDAATKQLSAKTGGKAYVVVLPSGEDPDDYTDIYQKMSMKGKDVLIATNGKNWELRCDAIGKGEKDALFQSALSGGGNPVQRLGKLMDGVPAAIARSQTAHGGKAIATTGARRPLPPSDSSGGFPWGWAMFGLLVAGVVGVVLFRRKQRDRRLVEDFKKALEPGEAAMAEVFLGMDGLESHPRFDEMLSRATGLSSKFDELKAQPPSRQGIAQAESLSKQARELHGQFRALGSSATARIEGF